MNIFGIYTQHYMQCSYSFKTINNKIPSKYFLIINKKTPLQLVKIQRNRVITGDNQSVLLTLLLASSSIAGRFE